VVRCRIAQPWAEERGEGASIRAAEQAAAAAVLARLEAA
jgi:dsRNA-specific ribonuclease